MEYVGRSMFIIQCTEDLGITILDAPVRKRLLSNLSHARDRPRSDLTLCHP